MESVAGDLSIDVSREEFSIKISPDDLRSGPSHDRIILMISFHPDIDLEVLRWIQDFRSAHDELIDLGVRHTIRPDELLLEHSFFELERIQYYFEHSHRGLMLHDFLGSE